MAIRDAVVAYEALFGRAERRAAKRAAHELAARDTRAVLEAIAAHGFSPPSDDATPLFILAAGWRSGSTLLQRLVMAGGERLIWGEPYDASRIVQRCHAQLLPFSRSWPASGYFLDRRLHADLSEDWIANLYPAIADLWCAHRALFDRLLAEPASTRGYAAWGLKEVRLSADDARYLQWLYPRARFLFLIRNPYDAWRSYRRRARWFASWPNGYVDTPWRFGRLWRRLAASFLRQAADIGGLLVHYETLHEDAVIERIGAYIGTSIASPRSIARLRGGGETLAWIPQVERLALRMAVAPVAKDAGYIAPSPVQD